MDDIHTTRTDLPTPEEIAPKVLSGTGIWWNCTVNREVRRRPFSARTSKSRYHAPRPVEAWTSGRAITSGHVSPLVQSARVILQKYDNMTRNEKLLGVLSANDFERRIDFIKCQSRRSHIKAGNENEKGRNIKDGNGNTSLPLSIQSKSMSNIDDQSAFVGNQSQHSLFKDDRRVPIVQFIKEEKQRVCRSPEGVFLTEVRDDWTEIKKKQLKVSFNVTDDYGFSKHVKNWSPKIYNSKINRGSNQGSPKFSQLD